MQAQHGTSSRLSDVLQDGVHSRSTQGYAKVSLREVGLLDQGEGRILLNFVTQGVNLVFTKLLLLPSLGQWLVLLGDPSVGCFIVHPTGFSQTLPV